MGDIVSFQLLYQLAFKKPISNLYIIGMNYIHLDSSVLTRQNYEITKNFLTYQKESLHMLFKKKYNLERGLIFNQSSFLFIL